MRRSLDTVTEPDRLASHLTGEERSHLPLGLTVTLEGLLLAAIYIINSQSVQDCTGKEILLPKKKFLMFAFSSTNTIPLDDSRSHLQKIIYSHKNDL